MPDIHLHLHITEAPKEWLERLTALLADLPADAATTGTDDQAAPGEKAGWTARRALHLVDAVNDGGRMLLRAAVEGDGRVDGPAYRSEHGEASLQGPSTSITRTLNRLISNGTLPDDIGKPLTASGPDKKGWSKTAFYYLAEDALPGFREAFRIYDAQRHGETDA